MTTEPGVARRPPCKHLNAWVWETGPEPHGCKECRAERIEADLAATERQRDAAVRLLRILAEASIHVCRGASPAELQLEFERTRAAEFLETLATAAPGAERA